VINYFLITLYHVQTFTINLSWFSKSTATSWLTPVSPTVSEESLDIPATLVDEKLMLTAYVCNIQFNTRPNSLVFISTNMRRLTPSAQCEPNRLTPPVRPDIGSLLREELHNPGVVVAVLSYSNVYNYASNRLRKLIRQDSCDVVPSTSSDVLILLLLCHLKSITKLKHTWN
jgi:hypothetical protein